MINPDLNLRLYAYDSSSPFKIKAGSVVVSVVL